MSYDTEYANPVFRGRKPGILFANATPLDKYTYMNKNLSSQDENVAIAAAFFFLWTYKSCLLCFRCPSRFLNTQNVSFLCFFLLFYCLRKWGGIKGKVSSRRKKKSLPQLENCLHSIVMCVNCIATRRCGQNQLSLHTKVSKKKCPPPNVGLGTFLSYFHPQHSFTFCISSHTPNPGRFARRIPFQNAPFDLIVSHC